MSEDDASADKRAPDKQRDAERGTLIILALVGVAVLLGIVSVLTRDDAPTRTAPTPNPFLTFTTVRNSCGQCGTSSPVGGCGFFCSC